MEVDPLDPHRSHRTAAGARRHARRSGHRERNQQRANDCNLPHTTITSAACRLDHPRPGTVRSRAVYTDMRVLFASLIVSLSIASPALAGKGVPIAGVDDGNGVAAAGSRYTTHFSGGQTVVTKTQGHTPPVKLRLNGHHSVPLVAYDGSTSGLSADGRRLVLIQPRTRFPRSSTRFVVIDARQMLMERRLQLRGDFSLDAVAPDGARLFLVNYLAPDETSYEVRSYDVARAGLVGGPIVDPREPDEKMVGLPVTRAASADGRWAYTLYDDTGGSHPFVHALDTRDGKANCVDLDALAARADLMDLRLRLEDAGMTLAIVNGDQPEALVDTRTFAVRPAAAAPAASRSPARGSGGGDGQPWIWVLLAAATLTFVVIVTSRTAREGHP